MDRFQEVVSLEAALSVGESHTIEFKESLALWKNAAQTVVAYANANGGSLFFGVTDDGQMSGKVTIGKDTLAMLATNLESVIYPYSPAAMDVVTHTDGQEAIRLSVWPDRPPVVGMYLFSSKRLNPDEPALTATMQGYRRVGRSNRKTPDLMLLRQPQPTDPILLATANGIKSRLTPDKQRLRDFGFATWMPDSSGGPALEITARLEPAASEPIKVADDLPGASGVRRVSKEIFLEPPAAPGDQFTLIVSYSDQQGCQWETPLQLSVDEGARPKSQLLPRRIVSLPPKRRMP